MALQCKYFEYYVVDPEKRVSAIPKVISALEIKPLIMCETTERASEVHQEINRKFGRIAAVGGDKDMREKWVKCVIQGANSKPLDPEDMALFRSLIVFDPPTEGRLMRNWAYHTRCERTIVFIGTTKQAKEHLEKLQVDLEQFKIPVHQVKNSWTIQGIHSRYANIPKESTLADLPKFSDSANPENSVKYIRDALNSEDSAARPPITVVLDDDPTGTQTCNGITVVTVWDINTLKEQFESGKPGFFVLTNTRAMLPTEAKRVITEICTNLKEACGQQKFSVILRSDSTLRGHMPLEQDAVEEVLGAFDLWIICPFFLAGGRYTIEDVHYVAEGDQLVPAADTPFAKDATFGYKASNLAEYVEEKTEGKVDADHVQSFSIQDIRQMGPENICERLTGLKRGTVCIVNAASDEDMQVFVDGLLRAERQGKRALCRTAASFVSTRLAVVAKPVIVPTDLQQELPTRGGVGGLIVVGSYVPKTTTQVEVLCKARGGRLVHVMVSAELVSCGDEAKRTAEMQRAIFLVERGLQSSTDVLLCTSRDLIKADSQHESLLIGSRVADALVNIVKGISTRPRFLLAKGGITSSDMVTKAMEAKSAEVLGQADPGVPFWALDSQSVYPGIPFIVFPGNVGSVDALANVVSRWSCIEEQQVSTTQGLLSQARAQSYAVGAFNIYDLNQAQAVVKAAEHTASPCILQIHPNVLRSSVGGIGLVRGCQSIAQRSRVPVMVHLDHATKEQDWRTALDLSLDSVMVDGSQLDYDENVVFTTKCVEMAHKRGILVEAELGRLSGTEDGITIEEYDAKLTDPQKAVDFCTKTGVDALAVCVGNVHGKYPESGPKIDLDRLKAIHEQLQQQCPQVLLVMHGASGLEKDLVEQCTKIGICKYNVNTEVRNAYVKALMERKEGDLLDYFNDAQEAMVPIIQDKFALFGSVNKA